MPGSYTMRTLFCLNPLFRSCPNNIFQSSPPPLSYLFFHFPPSAQKFQTRIYFSSKTTVRFPPNSLFRSLILLFHSSHPSHRQPPISMPPNPLHTQPLDPVGTARRPNASDLKSRNLEGLPDPGPDAVRRREELEREQVALKERVERIHGGVSFVRGEG